MCFPSELSIITSLTVTRCNIIITTTNNPDKYPTINLDGMELVCYVTTQGEPWCIAIPDTLLDSIINCYHQILSHIGITRLYNTISVHFYHKSLKNRIETFIQSCDFCQQTKLPGIGYGQLPPQDALIAQWLLQTIVQLMHLVVVTDHILFLVTLFVDKNHMIV